MASWKRSGFGCGLVHVRAFRTGDLSARFETDVTFFSFASIWLKLFLIPRDLRGLCGHEDRDSRNPAREAL